jgi:hypothetical protein
LSAAPAGHYRRGMRGRWLGVLVLVLVAAFGVQTAPAAADDASVWAAYTARDAEVDAVVRQSVKAFRAFSKRPTPANINAVIRLTRRQQVLSAEIGDAIQAQPSSTPAGEKGKALLVKGAVVTSRGWVLRRVLPQRPKVARQAGGSPAAGGKQDAGPRRSLRRSRGCDVQAPGHSPG